VLIGALIVAAVALVVIAVVAWPLVAHPAEEARPDREAEARTAAREELERSLEAIREIEMDHRAGNLSDEDYAALDRAERARAVELMRRAGELEDAPSRDAP
jgi:hypothetical protein